MLERPLRGIAMCGVRFRMTIPFVLLLLQLGCGGEKDTTLPIDLLGVWGTTAPQYLDCSFVLKPDVIIFNNGVNFTSVNRITHVEKIPEKNKTLYEITYVDEENFDYRLSLFYFKGGDRDIIRFKNQQQVIWTRKMDHFLSSS